MILKLTKMKREELIGRIVNDILALRRIDTLIDINDELSQYDLVISEIDRTEEYDAYLIKLSNSKEYPSMTKKEREADALKWRKKFDWDDSAEGY